MKYKKGDKVRLIDGIFDDAHHIEAGTLGNVTHANDDADGRLMVQFDIIPSACGLVILNPYEISPA
jgi:hypothetical protein